ncbi:MAG: chemotaxis protein CheW [Burkholderiaceae bacterium]
MSTQPNLAVPGLGPQHAARHRRNEFLTFLLGTEEYGIEILKVQEIRGWKQPTKIANAPPHINGVINLRGTIVPVIDMRIKFNLSTATYDAFTVVIILNVADRVVGMVVDSVSDVITLTEEQIRPAPGFSPSLGTDHITGLGAIDDRMLILLDIEKLMTGPGMSLFDAAH